MGKKKKIKKAIKKAAKGTKKAIKRYGPAVAKVILEIAMDGAK